MANTLQLGVGTDVLGIATNNKIAINEKYLWVGGSIWDAIHPLSYVQDNAAGTQSWWSYWLADTEDGELASSFMFEPTPSEQSTIWIRLTEWNIDIPQSAAIIGTAVSIKFHSDTLPTGSEFYTLFAQLIVNGSLVGDELIATPANIGSTTSRYYEIGNAREDWNAGLIPSYTNVPKFGVAVRAENTLGGGAGRFFYIDHVKITLYYITADYQEDEGEYLQMNQTPIANVGSILLSPNGSGNVSLIGEARFYLHNARLIAQYNDGGTERYKFLPLTGTSTAWSYSSTPP